MAEPDKNDPAPSNKPNWINSLAQRSTGLPTPQSPEPSTKPEPGDASLWSLAGLGLQFAATVGLLAFLGIGIDRRYGTGPWAVVTLSSVAFIGNVYLLIKTAIKRDKEPKDKGLKPPKGGT
ncbi:MAG TPA: AtpZ/AtpI family protein [Phycisphaerae bacterium]|nr:AtpZ/AtpI family protein [Phycisphaerae bacterium]